MLTNEDLQKINKNLEAHLGLFTDAEMERDQNTYCTFRPSELYNTKEAIDELLAFRSIRDAEDEEVEKLRRLACNLAHFQMTLQETQECYEHMEKLRDIAISRGQQFQSAQAEIERLKEEMETLVGEAEERANERGRQIAILTAKRDEFIDALSADFTEEVQRLTDCLKKANSQTEEMERNWYLEQNKTESLTEELAAIRSAPEMEEVNLLLSRNEELRDLLTSARAIAERKGADTAWERFSQRLADAGIGSVTAKVFKVLPSDKEVP